MMTTMNEVMTAITTAFPGIPILPVIGNNDVQYHNNAPNATDAPSYYNDLWNIFVEMTPINKQTWTDPQISTSFHTGGYYAFDLDHDVTVFSLNGMYPFDENSNSREPAAAMITWVGEQMALRPNKKFIMQYHVWAGCNFFYGLECFWV